MKPNESEPSPAQRALGDLAPKLVELTDDVLFGDVWERTSSANVIEVSSRAPHLSRPARLSRWSSTFPKRSRTASLTKSSSN